MSEEIDRLTGLAVRDQWALEDLDWNGLDPSALPESFRQVVADLEATGPMIFLKQVAGDWLPRLLARDESRHIAFGVHYLRARVPELELAERHVLEDRLVHWGGWLLESVRDPDLVIGLGVDANSLGAQLIDDLNLRISQVGLKTRI